MTRRALGSTLFPYTTLFRSSSKAARLWAASTNTLQVFNLSDRSLVGMTNLASAVAAAATVTDTLLVAAHADNVDRKSTRLNSSHSQSSYAVFCSKKKIPPPA